MVPEMAMQGGMSVRQIIERLAGYAQRLPVRWTTAALFALAIAYRDGLWLTTLQGASRMIERNQPPQLIHWLRDSTLALPLVFAAVLVALLCVRWWIEHSRVEQAGITGAIVLIFAVACAASAAQAAAGPLHDYLFQPQRLGLAHPHGTTVPQADGWSTPSATTAAAPLSYYLYCKVRGALLPRIGTSATVGSAVTRSEFAVISARIRALATSALMLVANLVLSAAVLVFVNDRLWSTPLAQIGR